MKTTVAIVGEFQIGKSTIVNCLLESCKAVTGVGLRTTAKNQRYELTPLVDLIDTPGFGAFEADDATASSAIKDAFAFVFVMEAKMLGEKIKKVIIPKMFKTGRRCVFVYNCNNPENWDPCDENNADICQEIDADLKNLGHSDLCMPVDGHSILKINALWACYGLGLLQQQAKSKNGKEEDLAKKSIRKIEKFIERELDDISPDRYQEEMLYRSNITVLRNFLEGMPMEVLKSFVQNTSREIKRISDRFHADLQTHCDEVVAHIKKRIKAK